MVTGYAAYRRWLDDAGDYRAKRRDTPRDMAQLQRLASDIDLEDKIIVDRTHYGE